MTHLQPTAPTCCTTWISWRSAIAGVVTALAVSIVLSLLGVALGFTMLDPMSNDPTAGIGTTFSIWSFISVLASLAAGGFVAGYSSTAKGCAHGFLTWATVLLIGTFITGQAISSASRVVGATVATVGSGAASVASGVAQGAQGLISATIEGIQKNVNLDIESEEFSQNVVAVLSDTGVETLQPQYLKGQMSEARSELRTAVNQLLMDSQNYDEIIENFLKLQKERLTAITAEIDKEAAVQAVMKKRQVTREEAEAMVDNALSVFNRVAHRTEAALTEAQHQFVEAKEHLRELSDQAKVKAEEWANAVARSSILAALALILGAIVSAVAGHFGNRCALRPHPRSTPTA